MLWIFNFYIFFMFYDDGYVHMNIVLFSLGFRFAEYYICWDILFLPRPYAFQTPYQNYPADLMTDFFYSSKNIFIFKILFIFYRPSPRN